jgi:ABC-type sulfate/molybdate transport systems ATPase subunit
LFFNFEESSGAKRKNLDIEYAADLRQQCVISESAGAGFDHDLEGERVRLAGRNGSGKSTFLQIAAGVMQSGGGQTNQRRDLVVGHAANV